MGIMKKMLLIFSLLSNFSWGQIGFSPGQSMDAAEALKAARASKAPFQDVEWIPINGGKFMTGAYNGFRYKKPAYEATVASFQMSKTLVTVEQYAQCYDDGKGPCSRPDAASSHHHCNWGKADRNLHPINCVSWAQASEYAKFKEARLPSESEWEYAARSGGKSQAYPWGDEAPTCDKAVMHDPDRCGFREIGTMPVCSKPAGNAKVSGGELCDMAGNVSAWMQYQYDKLYPLDSRMSRGGSWRTLPGDVGEGLRVINRSHVNRVSKWDDVGFRLVR
jgi:formylglycine-generating enzyme required for sulfatase activity